MAAIEDVRSIKMPADKLWKIHGLVDQAKNATNISAATKGLLPKLSQQIENGLSYANKNIKPLMADYKDLAKASEMSTKTYQGLRALLKRSPAISIPLYILGKSIGVTSRPQLIAKMGISGMGAIGLAGELERSLRLMNNPAFKRIYGDAVKAGIGSALRELSKAD